MRSALLSTTLSLSVFLAALVAASPDALAAPYDYSYEVENADAHADQVLVVWPRACGASGDPLGAVDLALNPDWATRMNDVDYEVVVARKHHQLQSDCKNTSQLYALPAGAFPRGSRDATADDSAIGQKTAGEKFAVLPALDAIDRKKRIDFFAKDPRVLRTTYRFMPIKPVDEARGGLKSVHDVLSVDAFDATSFAVTTKRVIYTYLDGRTEVEAAAVAPPTPSPMTSASASASASATTGATAGAENAPRRDLGTRWVYLAAVGGLVVGGIIAFVRRKRTGT